MFKERRDVKTEVTYTQGEPMIYVRPIALDKMALYVQACDKEIGWLGRVTKVQNMFVIEDVYLFKQEVHATTCEISPEGLADFVTDMYVNHSDIADDVLNNLRLWGHSHVNMAVSPSGQDNTQINTFKEANPWFIRVIANKAGEMEFSIFDFEQGIQFRNVKWIEYRENQLTLEEIIKAEIKEKVTTKTYQYQQTEVTPGVTRYNDKYTQTTEKKTTTVAQSGRGSHKNYHEYETLFDPEEVLRGADNVITTDCIENKFTILELQMISECETMGQAMTYIENFDVLNDFSDKDAMKIFEYAQNKYPVNIY